MFSFVPPTGGMFIWARFYFSSCPRFRELQADSTCLDPEATYETELWDHLAKALVSSEYELENKTKICAGSTNPWVLL